MSTVDQRRLAAIMFADMVGFSALRQQDEALDLTQREENRRIIRGLLSSFGGREVDNCPGCARLPRAATARK